MLAGWWRAIEAGVGAVAVAGLAVQCWRRRRGVYVSEILIFPVRSCRGVSVKQAAVTRTGLALDREYVLTCVDKDGTREILQNYTGQHPTTFRVHVRIDEDDRVVLFVGDDEFKIIPRADGPVVTADMKYNGTLTGRDQGEDVAAFLRKHTGIDSIRLLWVSEEFDRATADAPDHGYVARPGIRDLNKGNVTSFSVASAVSHRRLNRQIRSSGWSVPIELFRQNIIVDGYVGAWEEDSWATLQVGEVALHYGKRVGRCCIPTFSLDEAGAGRNRHNQPTRYLRQERAGYSTRGNPRDGTKYAAPSAFFGVDYHHDFVPGQVLRVGDPVVVRRARAPAPLYFGDENPFFGSDKAAQQRNVEWTLEHNVM